MTTELILTFAAILLISFVWALFSMRDLAVPDEIAKLLRVRRIKGSIVFFKDRKVKHYSSSSSRSSE